MIYETAITLRNTLYTTKNINVLKLIGDESIHENYGGNAWNDTPAQKQSIIAAPWYITKISASRERRGLQRFRYS